ncbi:MAG: ankyrin repeat domain-containing protein [Thermomicrobiales bacterium]
MTVFSSRIRPFALILGLMPTLATMSQATPSSTPEPDRSLGADVISAASASDTDTVRSLIARNAWLEARDETGATPLLIATHANDIPVATLLIEAGADVNAQDDIQDSPYLYAGARGLNEILLLTLDHGADLESINRFGGTALIPACERGHVETVRILIATGVDVNHVNRLGWTGLLEAIILSDGGPAHQQIVRLLIDAGADVNLADFDGVTPLQHAEQRGYTIIAGMLARTDCKTTRPGCRLHPGLVASDPNDVPTRPCARIPSSCPDRWSARRSRGHCGLLRRRRPQSGHR